VSPAESAAVGRIGLWKIYLDPGCSRNNMF